VSEGQVAGGAGATLRAGEAWPALERHHAQIADTHLRELFAADPDRGERMVADGAGLHLDFSKNRVVDETLILLGQLARERGVEARREAMFAGEHINVSEDRCCTWRCGCRASAR
jgi:glucose-6-phosphate isomerase